MGSTRPILNLSDNKCLGFLIKDQLDPSLLTVEYAQTKQVVETVQAMGKNAWPGAKDLKNGCYNVSVHKSEILRLGFIFDGKLYFFERLPMGSSSSPKIFTDFMHFSLWVMKNDNSNLYHATVEASSIDTSSFITDSGIQTRNGLTTIALIFNHLDDILGGHQQNSIAWKQLKHSETILRRRSLRTKDAIAKPPSQVQQWEKSS